MDFFQNFFAQPLELVISKPQEKFHQKILILSGRKSTVKVCHLGTIRGHLGLIFFKNKKTPPKKAKHTMSGTMSAVKIIKLEPGDDFALIKQEIDMLKVWF